MIQYKIVQPDSGRQEKEKELANSLSVDPYKTETMLEQGGGEMA